MLSHKNQKQLNHIDSIKNGTTKTLAIGIIFTAFHLIFSPFFQPQGAIGTGVGLDFSLALPALLDYRYWFINNGLRPPWFSPAFCAGQPLFADPQSVYYSPLTALSILVDPLTASYIDLVLFACAGFAGMHFFCRDKLKLTIWASFFAATLWAFNGFSTHHHLVGHVGFVPFYTAPFISWLLLANKGERWQAMILRIIAAALLIASALHAGLGSMMIPFGLSVIALGSLALLRGYPASPFYINGIFSALLAVGYCASKLVASFSTLGNFPRTHYPLPGVDSLASIGKLFFHLLFQPEETGYEWKRQLWLNSDFYIEPHELAFDITPAPLVVLIFGVLTWLYRRFSKKELTVKPEHIANAHILPILFSITAIVLIAYYSPEWNAFLKEIPIVKSTSAPWRWLVLVVPLICATSAISLDYISSNSEGKVKSLALILCVFILIFKATTPRDFYERQNYDPEAIIQAFQESKQDGFMPAIKSLGTYRDGNNQIVLTNHQNDLIAHGLSQALCYNPLFGYRREQLDLSNIAPGNPFKTRDGNLNFKNPVCYVFPEENGCAPGATFTDNEKNRENLKKLLEYKPYDFENSENQKIANWITKISLVISLLAAGASFFVVVRDRKRRINDQAR